MVNSPNPESSIGWLDANAAEQKRVDELLKAFSDSGTVDSLGIGTIRDSLADALAPGVSTAQTRLRYFLFLPWTFQRLAQENSRRPFAKRLRDYEVRLIYQLEHLGEKQGVIGLRSKESLSTMPSAAYWSGLGKWGIRQDLGRSLSISDVRVLMRQASAATGDDDQSDEATGGSRVWASGMPPAPEGFLDRGVTDQLKFELTRTEAEWLVGQLRETDATQDSFLTVAAEYALDRRAKKSEVKRWEMPWDYPAAVRDGLSDEHRELLRHAKCFAYVTWGPQLLYNLLLAEEAEKRSSGTKSKAQQKKASDRCDYFREKLDEWASEVSAIESELAQWNRDLNGAAGLWHLLEGDGGPTLASPLPERDKQFVEACSAATVNDPAGLFKNGDMRRRVLKRELSLKGASARLGTNPSQLNYWIDRNMPQMGRWLNYRWGEVHWNLCDIAEAR